jgi:hypothetical protein
MRGRAFGDGRPEVEQRQTRRSRLRRGETIVDNRRFDELARSLAAPSRRGLLKIAAAAGLGLAGRIAPAAVGAQDAAPAASCTKTGSNCKKNNDCCSKNCKNGTCKCGQNGDSCKNDNDCCSGTCKNKTCKCGKKGDHCKQNKDCCNNLNCKNNTCK